MSPRPLLLLCLLLTAALPARADWTGELAMTPAPGQPATPMGTARMKPGKMRLELTAPVTMTLVIDALAKRSYRIDDARHTYAESDLTQAGGEERRFPACTSSDVEKCLTEQGFKKTGSADANGYACDVYEIDRTSGPHALHQKLYRPTKLKGVLFTRIETSEGPHRSQMDLTNLKESKLDDALFKPPAGYKKVEMPAHPGMPPGMTQEQMQEMMKKYGGQQQQQR